MCLYISVRPPDRAAADVPPPYSRPYLLCLDCLLAPSLFTAAGAPFLRQYHYRYRYCHLVPAAPVHVMHVAIIMHMAVEWRYHVPPSPFACVCTRSIAIRSPDLLLLPRPPPCRRFTAATSGRARGTVVPYYRPPC